MLLVAKYLLLVISLFIIIPRSAGQELAFADSIKVYNRQRIKINRTGFEVLGAWGIANIAAGGAGYFGASGQGKYFSEMNGIWGVVNTGISVTALVMAKKQAHQKPGYQQAYDKYRSDKKLYLIASGLDVVYIGAGLGLASYGQSAKNNGDIYTGFGKSIALQGVFLLLFNNVMLLGHQQYSSRWYRLMDELRFTGKGIGFTHSF